MGRGKRARSLCLPESDIFGLVYSLRPAFLVEFFSSDSEIEFQLQQLSSKVGPLGDNTRGGGWVFDRFCVNLLTCTSSLKNHRHCFALCGLIKIICLL